MRSPFESDRSIISSLLDLVILVLIAVVLQNYSIGENRGIIAFLQLILSVNGATIIKRIFTHKKTREVCTIYRRPFGIQIEESVVDNDGNSRVGKTQFIPKELIVDVVVTEVVTSYRLMSIVVFRLVDDENKKTEEQEIENASLVTVFDPNKVEMRYYDCLRISQMLKKMLSIT